MVEPNGQVWTYYTAYPKKAMRYTLGRQGNLTHLDEEIFPGMPLRKILYACMYIQGHEEEGRLDETTAGDIGRFSRDIAFLAVLYAIRNHGYRLYDTTKNMEDTTIEWLRKSLNYSVPYSQRKLVVELLAELTAEELDR